MGDIVLLILLCSSEWLELSLAYFILPHVSIWRDFGQFTSALWALVPPSEKWGNWWTINPAFLWFLNLLFKKVDFKDISLILLIRDILKVSISNEAGKQDDKPPEEEDLVHFDIILSRELQILLTCKAVPERKLCICFCRHLKQKINIL